MKYFSNYYLPLQIWPNPKKNNQNFTVLNLFKFKILIILPSKSKVTKSERKIDWISYIIKMSNFERISIMVYRGFLKKVLIFYSAILKNKLQARKNFSRVKMQIWENLRKFGTFSRLVFLKNNRLLSQELDFCKIKFPKKVQTSPVNI